MNYPYQIPGSQTNPAAFVASSTGILGTYAKSVDARSYISVDYSKLIPAVTVTGYSFRVKPGGEPQLKLDTLTITSGTLLTFYVGGGISGRAYEVTINAKQANGETRSDVLNIQVLDDGSCACDTTTPVPPAGDAVSGDGSIYTNTSPRFFVSGTTPVGGNPLDQWYDTTTGDVYNCITNGMLVYWTLAIPAKSNNGGGSVVPSSGASIIKIAPITPDGTTTTFTLTALGGVPLAIVGTNSLLVSVDGVWQEPLVSYTADGTTIIFTHAPSADSKIFMLWFSAPDTSNSGSAANIVTIDPIMPDGTTTEFTLTAGTTPINIVGSNTLFVSVDGVWQEPVVQYIATVDLVTFIMPPTADAVIFMLWFAPPPPPPSPPSP